MRKNQHGFAHLVLIIIILVIAAVAGVGYRIYYKNNNQDQKSVQINDSQDNIQNNNSQKSTDTGCKPASAGLFTSDVTDLSNVTLIQNPIRIIGGSNIKTHSYIEVSKKSPVYAPMDATLSGGANYMETMGPQPVTKVQYILSFNDGCDVNFWLDHIVDVPEKIKEAFPAEPQNGTQSVEVKKLDLKAGELVGYSNQEGQARFDFGAINLKGPETSLTTNPRFKDDPIVKTSDKYRYATCPYNLYSSDKQKVYQALYDSNSDGDQEIIDDICE
ncbi:hypothetical protein DYH10_00830 [Candidatus Saccharibacteria bacterium CPR2]|nr:hypothetical protein [Candidatus Saccharibacteria bacterium CPR2]